MGIKLVIVDDAPFIRESLRYLISGTEFECIGEASNGNDAVELVKQLGPDLVIMDLVLPHKNGIEATREIIADRPNVKIVACSTEGQEEMMLLALKAGCCHFIKKPYEKADVLRTLRAAMTETSTLKSKRLY